jgi:hypothetical protein
MSEAVPGQVLPIRTGANTDFAHPERSEIQSYQGALRSLSPLPGKKEAAGKIIVRRWPSRLPGLMKRTRKESAALKINDSA